MVQRIRDGDEGLEDSVRFQSMKKKSQGSGRGHEVCGKPFDYLHM